MAALNADIGDDLKAAVKKAAIERNVTMKTAITEALETWLAAPAVVPGNHDPDANMAALAGSHSKATPVSKQNIADILIADLNFMAEAKSYTAKGQVQPPTSIDRKQLALAVRALRNAIVHELEIHSNSTNVIEGLKEALEALGGGEDLENTKDAERGRIKKVERPYDEGETDTSTSGGRKGSARGQQRHVDSRTTR